MILILKFRDFWWNGHRVNPWTYSTTHERNLGQDSTYHGFTLPTLTGSLGSFSGLDIFLFTVRIYSGKLLQIWGECLGGISHPVVMTLQDMASSTFMGSVYDSQLRSENRMRDQNFAVFERHSLPTLQTTEEATNNHNWIYCLLNNSWSWKTLCLQTMIIGFEKEGTQGLANIQTRKHLGIVWFPAKEAHLREQPC